ncbi:hypothetical protein PRZ48_013499 [Zasmidium cellare]|uniref:Glycosyl transferase CAP10 domain-containing protein n=1 Tax=Zasmidium cellare TaxID=395010 RepID=A0ABR0E167_ZASCE|nr:hypothetical protein PRZ48_013499 [Zasmidium cellare]
MAVTGNRLLTWRLGCFGLFGLLVLTFLVNAPQKATTAFSKLHGSVPSLSQDTTRWGFGNATAYNEGIDGLTDAQCDAEFPDLYLDVDRAVKYWNDKGHITAPDVDISESRAAVKILIHEKKLRVLHSISAVSTKWTTPERTLAVLHMIQRVLDAATVQGEQLPTIEVALNFQDDADPVTGTHSFWSFARALGKETHQNLWLMPNFDFWYYDPYGSFADAKWLAMQHDGAFASKIPKIVWRGNANFGAEIRAQLVDVAKGQPWADVEATDTVQKDQSSWMDPDALCDYAMTVYTEGATYSGRLKFLLNCQSLLFVHEPEYVTHYSHLLKSDGPEQNCVLVKRDWSDLEEKVRWYLDHPDEAERIIANSLATFRSRYTTQAATSCYLRRLIQGYAKVAFTPETHVPLKVGTGTRLRGWSYEKYIASYKDGNFEAEE